MDDPLYLLIRVLLWPYLWWRGHNQSSRLGTSLDEEEAENFWLKFALWSVGLMTVVALVLRYRYPTWSQDLVDHLSRYALGGR